MGIRTEEIDSDTMSLSSRFWYWLTTKAAIRFVKSRGGCGGHLRIRVEFCIENQLDSLNLDDEVEVLDI